MRRTGRTPILAAQGVQQILHRHDEGRIVLFLGGVMHEEAFEGHAKFVRGDFVFRPAHFAHADTARSGGARFVRLPVSPRAARRWVDRNGWGTARGHVDLDEGSDGDALLEVAGAHVYRQTPPSTPMQHAATALAVEETPRVQDVARRFGMAPYELTRRFAAAFGMTPNTYRRQARVQRAIRLLFERSTSLAQIAIAAGYHDQSHMSAALKRELGLTPGGLLGGAS